MLVVLPTPPLDARESGHDGSCAKVSFREHDGECGDGFAKGQIILNILIYILTFLSILGMIVQ